MIGDCDLRSSLTILGTMPSDTGEYLCQAQNIIGSAAGSAFLNVQGDFVWLSIYYVLWTLVLQRNNYVVKRILSS